MLNKLKSEEILTYLLLIVIGYFIAKMFSRVCMNRVNRFSVGGRGGRGRGTGCPPPPPSFSHSFSPPPAPAVEKRNGIPVTMAYGILPPLVSTCSHQKMATTPTLLGHSGADRAEIARRTRDCHGRWEEEWKTLNPKIGSDGRDGRSRQEMINHDWSYFGT